MPELSSEDFDATFAPRMIDITGREGELTRGSVLDLRPYLAEAIQGTGVDYLSDLPIKVYRTPDGGYDHVLFAVSRKETYLVVVVDLWADRIHGHHLLDLAEKYGLE
jgi:hypothetical protein